MLDNEEQLKRLHNLFDAINSVDDSENKPKKPIFKNIPNPSRKPKRETVISEEDIFNIRLDLELYDDVDKFIENL